MGAAFLVDTYFQSGISGVQPKGDVLRFGATVCMVRHPSDVIERIRTAMSEAWQSHQHRLEGSFAGQLDAEWEVGRQSLAPARVRFSNGEKP